MPSSLVFGGRRVEIQRPRARARGANGRELSLPSWRTWRTRDPLDERAFEQMVLGVSTRRYARSLESLPEEIAVRGISKSAVSERFVVGTQKKLAELMRRRLGGLKLLAVMIDGVRFADHVVLVAIGIDLGGKKHVLGLREGATENAAACKALLADLIERGVDVSEVFHGLAFSDTDETRLPGPDPERSSYRSFASFSDPDGNEWLLQELTTRLPGR